MNANNKQVAGTHYNAGEAGIQHWDLVHANDLCYLVGCATKYLTRFRKKSGLQDLQKALHYTEKLVEVNAKMHARSWEDVDQYTLEKFFADNGIVGIEREPIRLLINWSTLADLKVAKVWIETLIAEYDGSEPTPGYVKQG